MSDIVSGNRKQYFDILKGIATVLVVLGHCIQYGSGTSYLRENMFFSNILFKWIYSFHMPLFAVISGYFFGYSIQKRTVKELIQSKFRTLFVPIISWGVINVVWKFATGRITGNIFLILKSIISTMINSLWFLWVMLYASIIVAVICRLFRDSVWIYVFIGVLFFLIPDGYNLGYLKFLYPFFVGGYIFSKSLCKLRGFLNERGDICLPAIILLICVLMHTLLLRLYKNDIYIYTSGFCIIGKETPLHQIYCNILRWMVGTVGCVAVIIFMYFAVRKMERFSLTFIILSEIGMNSLGIYASNQFMNTFLVKITGYYGGVHTILLIIETILMTAVCYGVAKLLACFKITRRTFLGGRV